MAKQDDRCGGAEEKRGSCAPNTAAILFAEVTNLILSFEVVNVEIAERISASIRFFIEFFAAVFISLIHTIVIF